MSVKENVGCGILGLTMIAVNILCVVIHVWTIVIAFLVSGIFAAVITFIFPVVSEVYWFLNIGANVGFGTTYCVSIMVLIVLFVVMFIGDEMMASSRE